MKKVISYLITAMMVFTMIPYTAFATDTENESITVSYSKVNPVYEDVVSEDSLLSGIEPTTTFSSEINYASTTEEAADVVREYMINRVDSFMFYYKYPADQVDEAGTWFQTLCDEVFDIACQHNGTPVAGDYLKYTFGGMNVESTSVSGDGTYYYLEVPMVVTYYTTYDQEEELTEEINAVLTEVVTDDMSDYEKIKAIYDFMTANITYDYTNLNDSAYLLKYTAYAALVNKTSVCQGYANLFYRLALECGVDARIITGTGNGEGHAWNIVKLGSKYYLVDATWDATYAQAGYDYKYFLKSEFSDHITADDFLTESFTSTYPMADAEYVPGSESEETEEPTECTHEEITVLEAVAATCTETGLTEGSKCAVCSEILKVQEEVPALGHDKVAHEAQAATCSNIGWEAYETCNRCDYTTYEEIAVSDHSFEWVIDTPATEETFGVKHEECTACGEKRNESTAIPKLDHTHNMVKTEAVAATCTNNGNIEYYKCSSCASYYADETGLLQITEEDIIILATGHDSVIDTAVAATCTATGLTEGSHCKTCGEVLVAQTTVAALGHTWETDYTVDKTAGWFSAGSKSIHCATCDVIKDNSSVKIFGIKSAVMNKIIYNGSNRTPNPVVKNGAGKQLVRGTDYTVVYKNKAGTKVVKPNLVGQYTVIIKFKGAYAGAKDAKRTLTITPKKAGPFILSKNGKKQFTVKWTKRTVQATGYQIKYSTNKNMSNAKLVNVTNYKTNKKTIKNLKAKKWYYVQVRTYKTVNGQKIFSDWTSKKSILTK